MKKILFVLLILFSACKKECVKPEPAISEDSLKAKELNISTTQYLQIKALMNSLSNGFTQANPGNKNVVSDSLDF